MFPFHYATAMPCLSWHSPARQAAAAFNCGCTCSLLGRESFAVGWPRAASTPGAARANSQQPNSLSCPTLVFSDGAGGMPGMQRDKLKHNATRFSQRRLFCICLWGRQSCLQAGFQPASSLRRRGLIPRRGRLKAVGALWAKPGFLPLTGQSSSQHEFWSTSASKKRCWQKIGPVKGLFNRPIARVWSTSRFWDWPVNRPAI